MLILSILFAILSILNKSTFSRNSYTLVGGSSFGAQQSSCQIHRPDHCKHLHYDTWEGYYKFYCCLGGCSLYIHPLPTLLWEPDSSISLSSLSKLNKPSQEAIRDLPFLINDLNQYTMRERERESYLCRIWN